MSMLEVVKDNQSFIVFICKVQREIYLESVHYHAYLEMLDLVTNIADDIKTSDISNEEAIKLAIKRMGSPAKIGKSFNRKHRAENFFRTSLMYIMKNIIITLIISILIVMFQFTGFPVSVIAVLVSLAAIGSAIYSYTIYSKWCYILFNAFFPAVALLTFTNFQPFNKFFRYISLKSTFPNSFDLRVSTGYFVLALIFIMAYFLFTFLLNLNRYFIKDGAKIKFITTVILSFFLVVSIISNIYSNIQLRNSGIVVEREFIFLVDRYENFLKGIKNKTYLNKAEREMMEEYSSNLFFYAENIEDLAINYSGLRESDGHRAMKTLLTFTMRATFGIYNSRKLEKYRVVVVINYLDYMKQELYKIDENHNANIPIKQRMNIIIDASEKAAINSGLAKVSWPDVW